MLRRNVRTDETIFALCSGRPPSAIAVYRVSGPNAFDAIGRLFSKKNIKKERGMHFGDFHALDGRLIDTGLLLCFVAPHSFTGEDCIEIQCHGSLGITKKLEDELKKLGIRPAVHGEFSYRAFLNGKLDSSELDELADLFKAETISDIDAIYSRRDGSFSRLLASIKEHLLAAQAIFDTAVDFSEEYSSVVSRASGEIEAATQQISVAIHRNESFQSLNHPKIAIVGRPNAGKSSLLNAILCRQRAIVHSEAGTTRDVLEENIEIGGRVFTLADTAGIRDAQSEPERLGLELGEKYLQASIGMILVVDGTEGMSPVDYAVFDRNFDRPCLVVWNKSDLNCLEKPPAAVGVSTVTGDGLNMLANAIEQTFTQGPWSPLPSVHETARLKAVLSELGYLSNALNENCPPEILSEKNREILQLLELVLGPIDVEQVLDRVFSTFCIGK